MTKDREYTFDDIDIANIFDQNGQGILQKIAASSIHLSHNQNSKLINYFVEVGCDMNLQDISGKTAMHIAVIERNVNCLDTLLACGSDVNITDNAGETVFTDVWKRIERGNNNSFDISSYRLLTRHINKMKIAGIWLSEQNDFCYSNSLKRFKYYDHDNMTFHSRELQKINSIILRDDDITLKDFLAKNGDELFKSSTNEVLTKIENIMITLNKEFPIFGNVLKMQFLKGSAMKRFIEQAKITLESLVGQILPDLCFQNIKKYLNYTDLQNIICTKKFEHIHFFLKKDNLANYLKFILESYIN